jgi:hypothetical protein
MPKKTPKPPETEQKSDSYGTSSRGEGLAPQIRHTRPEVAKHCARMIIANNMDTRAAVSKMLATDYPEATEAQIESLSRTIQASPYVQREMTALLEELGYGNDALKKLIGLLWAEALGANDKRWPAAVRLLAEITGAQKAASKNDTIPRLRLAGMDDGLKSMLGDAAPTDNDADAPIDDIMNETDETDVEEDADASN